MTGMDTIIELLGFQDKGETYQLGDEELDCMVRGLTYVIFQRRLLEARLEGPEAYKEEQ